MEGGLGSSFVMGGGEGKIGWGWRFFSGWVFLTRSGCELVLGFGHGFSSFGLWIL